MFCLAQWFFKLNANISVLTCLHSSVTSAVNLKLGKERPSKMTLKKTTTVDKKV